MTDNEILDAFTGILRGILDDESIALTSSTARDQVPAWDSFAYISFIAAVEQRFGVKFSVSDIESFRTVGDIAAATARLQGRS